MARESTTVARAGARTTTFSSLPSPAATPLANGKVSIGPVKEIVRKLPLGHPLRVVVLSEPDEIDGNECFVKLSVWLRLLPKDG